MNKQQSIKNCLAAIIIILTIASVCVLHTYGGSQHGDAALAKAPPGQTETEPANSASVPPAAGLQQLASNADFIFTHSYSPGHSYRIHLPGAWQGKYSVKETEDMITFYFYKPVYYNVRPGSEQKVPGGCDPIFGIDMLTNSQWEKEKQGPGGYGIELASRDGLVFVLTPSIVNDYTGQDAIEYGKMADDAWLGIGKTFEFVEGK